MTQTPAQRKAVKEYKRRQDLIRIMVPPGTKARWQEAAAKRGTSMTQMIVTSVEERIADLDSMDSD